MNLKNILFTTLRRRLIDDDLLAWQHLLSGKVLDLGGGRTRGKFPHGRELDWTVLDIDFEFKPAVVGDAQILPFANNSFDSVKCSELTGYLFEPLKMLHEVKRVLKPKGAAVFTSPFLTPFDFDQHDSTRLTSAWWIWAAGRAGFKVEKIKPQGYMMTVLADAEKYWISHWWGPFRVFGYLIMIPVYELLFWWEQHLPVPDYFKRFTTGFLIILKKNQAKIPIN
ncbi:methyltransferase domain-containing protein [Candidatus Collierbacteria bacterium]|nr:methyltransferase domain-containing protein [Candidatus Collierbacteria bacterium]